jgi:hypothetical protein
LSFAFLPGNAFCGKVYLGADTQIMVVILDLISSGAARPESLNGILAIDSTYYIAGIEVFRKGGKVAGKVIEYSQAGHLGKAGFLKIRIDSLQTAVGKMVAVRPLELSAAGKAQKLKAYLMLPLLGYGYFVKGTDAVLGQKGQKISVRTVKFEEIEF